MTLDPRRRPTIIDVAVEAGVSKSLVSRVVTGRGYVGAASRDRIERAMTMLGYSPNSQARGLAAGRLGVTGVLLRSATSSFYGRVFSEAQSYAAREGQRVIAATGDLSDGSEVDALVTLAELRVDGLIIGSGTLADDKIAPIAARTPSVVLGREASGVRADVVRYDTDLVGRELVTRLVSLGHRRIGLLSSPGSLSAGPREVGVHIAAAEAGVEVVETVGTYDYEPAMNAATALLRARPDLTALVTLSPNSAHAAVHAAGALGVRVPHDVSVIAVDAGVPDPRYGVRLSGVAQDIPTTVVESWRLLSERIAEPSVGSRRVLVPGIAVEGETVGPARD